MAENIIKLPKNLTGKTIVTPEGKIRPGKRKPFTKANADEIDRRVEELAHLLRVRPLMKKHEIHKFCKEKFNIEYLMCDLIYVKRAKEFNRKLSEMTKEEARAIGVGVVMELLDNEKPGIQLQAAAQFADIYGYNAPGKMTLDVRRATGPDQFASASDAVLDKVLESRGTILLGPKKEDANQTKEEAIPVPSESDPVPSGS